MLLSVGSVEVQATLEVEVDQDTPVDLDLPSVHAKDHGAIVLSNNRFVLDL